MNVEPVWLSDNDEDTIMSDGFSGVSKLNLSNMLVLEGIHADEPDSSVNPTPVDSATDVVTDKKEKKKEKKEKKDRSNETEEEKA